MKVIKILLNRQEWEQINEVQRDKIRDYLEKTFDYFEESNTEDDNEETQT